MANTPRANMSGQHPAVYIARVHTGDALQKGENPDSLSVLPAWAESDYFSEPDRAALGLAETTTLVADGHVSEADYDAASDVLTTVMNAFNRVAITNRYHVGLR